MQERTCPACSVDLETDECWDGYIGLTHREEEWFGHCPQCGAKYHWVEVYEYKETRDFEVCIDTEETK